jgi:hypothetical protein
VLYLVTVLVHNLIILWGLDDLHLRTIKSKSLRFRWRGYRYFYVLFYGHLADVPPVPDVRSKVRRRGSRYRRSTECCMTFAVRGIVELFRLVKRENELYREILAFLISHDHQTVRIYGHYLVIDRERPLSIATRLRSLASRAKKAKTSGPCTNSLKTFTIYRC